HTPGTPAIPPNAFPHVSIPRTRRGCWEMEMQRRSALEDVHMAGTWVPPSHVGKRCSGNRSFSRLVSVLFRFHAGGNLTGFECFAVMCGAKFHPEVHPPARAAYRH